MLCKSNAVVIKTIKYSETGYIVKTYTQQFGLKSFLLKGYRKAKTKKNMALFQPMQQVEIVFVDKNTSSLIIPTEINLIKNYKTLHFDIYKSSILIFINELLYRTIKEEEPNLDFYSHIIDFLNFLDETDEPVSNLHLVFAMQITHFLGFYPLGLFLPSTPYFSLKEGQFKKHFIENEFFLNQNQSELFSKITVATHQEAYLIKLSNKERKMLLENIILYYQLHLIGFSEFKSLDVLAQIFQSDLSTKI